MEIRPEWRVSPRPMTDMPAGTCSTHGSRRHADVISMFMSSSSTPFAPLGPRPKGSGRTCACREIGKGGATAQPWSEIANVREKRGVDSDWDGYPTPVPTSWTRGLYRTRGEPKGARPVSLTRLLTFTLCPLTLVHPAHARTAVGMAAGRFLLLLGDLGDEGFGCEQQRRDRRGVL